mmetsp:Transcript_14305/g.31358  ORF Transcript_14305/g.31358 Transcript_14305/m.31358 type:complete len:317 (+) Transcript_14305:1203-2153(+)
MAEPAATSMPHSTMRRPRSVQFCFMTEEMTMGASWLSTMAFMTSPPAMVMRPSLPAFAMASCIPPNSAMGTRNCFLTLEYAPTPATTDLAAPMLPAGRLTPLPSARHSTNMFHPKPHRPCPPRMESMGIQTSSPSTVPFMKAALRGMWRGPMRSPSCPRSSSATVNPSSPSPPSSPSGSLRLSPRPTTPATGARVMYLFLKLATTPSSPVSGCLLTTQSLPMRLVASLPLCGPVRPKQGMSVPSARRGRKYSFWSGVPYLTRSSPGPSELGTATVALASKHCVASLARIVLTACVLNPSPPHSLGIFIPKNRSSRM